MPVGSTEGNRNAKGEVRRVWPTLMSYHQSRGFRLGRAGCVYDAVHDTFTEPSAEERELAMGFEPSCTAAPGLSDLDRCSILGQSIDLNALFMLFQAAQHLQEAELSAPNRRVSWKPIPAAALPARLAEMQPPLEAQTAEPAVVQAAHSASGDIWLDTPVLQYLRAGNHDIHRNLSARALRRAKSYAWFNNRLHRIVADAYTGQAVYRQVPPPEKRDKLILSTHESLGHLGEKRTISAMAQTYWWYGMTVDIRRVLSGCKLCARVRASSGEQPRDMQTEPASEYGMFHRWGLDYAQDLPISARGNTHCLIMVDYFSKWIEAVPTRDLSSATTANAFHLHVCARFGLPAEVITDNGSPFKDEFAALCERKFIHHRVITADIPRSNGLAERAVQTIKAALRKHVADRHNALTWDTEGLTNILTGYRCTTQAATGHSPARILFALDPVLDAEQYYARREPLDFGKEVPIDLIAADLLQRSQVVSEIGHSVAHNLRTAHERDCRRFKARRSGLYVPRIHHFAAGDYVFVLAQGQKPGGTLGIRARNEVLRVVEVRPSGVLVLVNQAGRTIEKHYEHCVPCMLPNLLGETHAGLVKPQADLPCQICGDHRHWESMLLCDSCDTGWHMYCLDPPLQEVPPEEWLCPDCLTAGVTLESLAQKQQQYVGDPESRPNLELPSRRRMARAKELADAWHGKAIAHTRKGVQRLGRVAFQGALHEKWFRIDWSDGTSSEHNAGILRHLLVLDEQAVTQDKWQDKLQCAPKQRCDRWLSDNFTGLSFLNCQEHVMGKQATT